MGRNLLCIYSKRHLVNWLRPRPRLRLRLRLRLRVRS
jgi:hypothetical protein